jgi:hypothetical protein
MSGVRKSTDAGLTSAERKSLRESEAQEAMSDHMDAERPFTTIESVCALPDWRARPWLARGFIPPWAFQMRRLSLTSAFRHASQTRSMGRASKQSAKSARHPTQRC